MIQEQRGQPLLGRWCITTPNDPKLELDIYSTTMIYHAPGICDSWIGSGLRWLFGSRLCFDTVVVDMMFADKRIIGAQQKEIQYEIDLEYISYKPHLTILFSMQLAQEESRVGRNTIFGKYQSIQPGTEQLVLSGNNCGVRGDDDCIRSELDGIWQQCLDPALAEHVWIER